MERAGEWSGMVEWLFNVQRLYQCAFAWKTRWYMNGRVPFTFQLMRTIEYCGRFVLARTV